MFFVKGRAWNNASCCLEVTLFGTVDVLTATFLPSSLSDFKKTLDWAVKGDVISQYKIGLYSYNNHKK